MTTQLNTLFVTTEGAFVGRDHQTLVVKIDGVTKVQVPLLHLAGVVCHARVLVSPEAMAALTEQGATVSFLSMNGAFLARVEGMPGGSVLLRRAQFRAADDVSRSHEIARGLVAGKVANARAHLQRAARESEGVRGDAFATVVGELELRLREVERSVSVEQLRGIEGLAARQYWGVFDQLIKRQRESFEFQGRTRRPPGDRVNALLSWGYALLMHDCAAACASVGLDAAVGYLHEDRPGRLSLALDLMEEFRVPLVDRLVIALINREQIKAHDLVEDPAGGWQLTKDGKKTFLTAWQAAKQEQVLHPFLEETMPVQRLPSIQALLLARFLRGDLDAYPPFVIR